MVESHECRERQNAVIESLQPLPFRAAITDGILRATTARSPLETETVIGPGDSIFVKVNVATVPKGVGIAESQETHYPENDAW